MEKYTWKQIEREEKIEDAKRKVKDKINKAKDFVARNKSTILITAPFALAFLSEANKAANRRERARDERRRECRIYDPSLGDYWELKKPLTNNERLEMTERINNGECRGSILDDMGKLKK